MTQRSHSHGFKPVAMRKRGASRSRQSYLNLYFHIIFATKHRAPVLQKSVWPGLREALKTKATELKGVLHLANGYLDHVHLLLSLPPTISIATAVKYLKGYSSHQLPSVYWQNGYYAATVDRFSFDTIFNYIRGQWQKHATADLVGDYEI